MSKYGKSLSNYLGTYFNSDADSWYAAALNDWDDEEKRAGRMTRAEIRKASADAAANQAADAAYLKQNYNYTLGDTANLASARTPGTAAASTTSPTTNSPVTGSITPTNLASTSSILNPSPSSLLSTIPTASLFSNMKSSQGGGSSNYGSGYYAAQLGGQQAQYAEANKQNLEAEDASKEASLRSALLDRYAQKEAALKQSKLDTRVAKVKNRAASKNLLSLNSTSFFNNPTIGSL